MKATKLWTSHVLLADTTVEKTNDDSLPLASGLSPIEAQRDHNKKLRDELASLQQMEDLKALEDEEAVLRAKIQQKRAALSTKSKSSPSLPDPVSSPVQTQVSKKDSRSVKTLDDLRKDEALQDKVEQQLAQLAVGDDCSSSDSDGDADEESDDARSRKASRRSTGRTDVKHEGASSQTLRWRLFSVDEFHYLKVIRVGTFTVYDDFDCTYKCLRNPLCFSVNLAASKGADGKLWCELLSSDKYRNANDFIENKGSHHLSIIMSPCSSSPCQNGGTCLPNYNDGTFECLCEKGLIGKYCEKAAKSCKELYDVFKSSSSQLVTLYFESKPTSVLCHFGDFGCGDGGWTPVMKIDGNQNTFHFNSGYWSNQNEYNLPGGETGFDSRETKLPSYWNTSFSKICLGMKIGQQINFIVINKQANSLYSLIADGQYRATSLGRDTWKTLLGSQASLQSNCNKEGFNVVGERSHAKARIGIIGNDQNHCDSCNSRIGFGTGGVPDDSNTCGNEARWSDNGDKHVKAMGYVLVQ